MRGHSGRGVHHLAASVGTAALLCTAGAVDAQVFAELGIGAAYQSDLVRDSIVQPLRSGLALAPAVDVAVGTPLDGRHQVAVRLGWSRSNLERRELGAVTSILSVTVWSAGVQLRRSLRPGVVARLDVGGIKYAPDPDARAPTIFRDDAPVLPTFGVGARLERRVSPRVVLGFEVVYGIHQFTTLALRDDGFGGHRTIHRVHVALVLRGGHDQLR